MLKEEMKWVVDTIKAEIAEAIKSIKVPAPIPPKPVDVDEIVKLVLDKIQPIVTESPKKGKEK